MDGCVCKIAHLGPKRDMIARIIFRVNSNWGHTDATMGPVVPTADAGRGDLELTQIRDVFQISDFGRPSVRV